MHVTVISQPQIGLTGKPIQPLGGIAGLGRDTVKIGKGTAVGGFDVADDTRQFSVQNYHLIEQRRNVSSTVSMPPIGNPDPMGCLSCSDSHSLTESLHEQGDPCSDSTVGSGISTGPPPGR
jgi:hypothetical protein